MKLSKTNDQSNFTCDMVIALKYSLIPIKSRIILQLSELPLWAEPNCASVLRPSQVTQMFPDKSCCLVWDTERLDTVLVDHKHPQITLLPKQTGRLSSFSPLPAFPGRPEGCARFRTCFLCNLMMLTLRKVTITTDGKINAHIQGQNLAEAVLVPSEITNRIKFTAWILAPFIKSGKIMLSKQSNFSWNKNLSWLKITGFRAFVPDIASEFTDLFGTSQKSDVRSEGRNRGDVIPDPEAGECHPCSCGHGKL